MAEVIVNGSRVDFDAAVKLMDGELREQLYESVQRWIDRTGAEKYPEQTYVDDYARLHAQKFDGEVFKAD